MKKTLQSSLLSVALLILGSCLDPYNPPATGVDVNYLVVDGFINTGGPTQIKLSRTSPIDSTDVATAELGATVNIFGDDGSNYPLVESSPGNYTLPATPFDPNRKYQLFIRTIDQRQYNSDFVGIRSAPPIDTVYYGVTGEDLQFYLTSHDNLNNTRYYQWRFIETWKYHSRYTSDYIFENGDMVARPDNHELYNCWSTLNSNQIMLGSTARLSQDVIQDFPFYGMNVHDKRLQLRYSILVQQFALTQEAYDYWELLKKSTETNGSIFDPQPSQGLTNLHCVTHPDEPVVGYLSAGSYTETRIFIDTHDLPVVTRNTGYEECYLDTMLLAEVPSFDGVRLVFTGYWGRTTLLGYLISSPFCIDCRLNGGTTTQPPFWQ